MAQMLNMPSRFGSSGRIPICHLLCDNDESEMSSTALLESEVTVPTFPSLTHDVENAGSPKSESRKRWMPWEDEIVVTMVQKQGPRKWNQIAEKIPGRNGNQVRLRWTLYLCPDISKEKFTPEQDARLLALQSVYGNNWKLIGAMIGANRSINDIKNRYHALSRKRNL
mmetsp:Transcript_32604/g.33251  ORF Transcript_32604/g.33251 Transcript_32604/m.33251 type:complete len:168 (+) Transcript_32604:63-566(+)